MLRAFEVLLVVVAFQVAFVLAWARFCRNTDEVDERLEAGFDELLEFGDVFPVVRSHSKNRGGNSHQRRLARRREARALKLVRV